MLLIGQSTIMNSEDRQRIIDELDPDRVFCSSCEKFVDKIDQSVQYMFFFETGEAKNICIDCVRTSIQKDAFCCTCKKYLAKSERWFTCLDGKIRTTCWECKVKRQRDFKQRQRTT